MLFKDEGFAAVWEEYKAMRKKKKKALTDGAEKRQLNRVQKLREAGLSEENIISHLHDVIDSLWDNVYSNEQHFNDIVSKYLKPTIQNGAKNTTTKSASSKGSNYYTYHKGTAYEQTAADLLRATTGFNFVGKVRPE